MPSQCIASLDANARSNRSIQARLLWGRPGLILAPLGRLCQAGPRSAWFHMYDCLCWCQLVVEEYPRQALVGRMLICDPLDRANLQGQAKLAWRPKTLWAHECGHFQPLLRRSFNITVEGAPPGWRPARVGTHHWSMYCMRKQAFLRQREGYKAEAGPRSA